MSERIEIEQKAGMGSSDVTQIGTQINNNGLSPLEACRLATDLFYQNFPQLQEQAMNVVKARVEELMTSLAARLEEKNVHDLSPLTEPDLQYVILEAQKGYARFEKKEMLATLTDLIATRIKENDKDICLKVAIDRAIEVAGLLNKKHLDFLALLFAVTKVRFHFIHELNDLKDFLNELDRVFPDVDKTTIPYLNLLDCLQLELPDVVKILSRMYNVSGQQVKEICPTNILGLSGDYNTSNVGTILAIVHLENCTRYCLNPEIWIHE